MLLISTPRKRGIQSAKAAVAILEGEGVIGTVGYENGRTGDINTCFQRYEGWNEVFEEAGRFHLRGANLV